MATFYSLKITRIVPSTPNSVVISLGIPEDLKPIFAFQPGQYITIKIMLRGEEIRRSYSICSGTGDPEISVGIKKIEGGTFSVYANNALQVGDVLEVHPPEGRFIFTANPTLSRNIIAFAAGSGITPIMSIARELLTNEPSSNFILVYGNRSVKETMFYNEILSLIKAYKSRLKVHFIYSRQQEDDAMFGRIEAATVNYIIKNSYPSVHLDAAYLCGPEEMIQVVTQTLSSQGFSDSSIYSELFTPSEDSQTGLSEIPEGKAMVKGVVDDDAFEFVMTKDTRVLDAALENGVDAPYSCQGGICSSCIARVKEGQVEMVKNQILTDSEIKEGLILTCQSHPVSDVLIIDYDDV